MAARKSARLAAAEAAARNSPQTADAAVNVIGRGKSWDRPIREF